jgi:replicative DNA helicase Mcm
MVSKWEAFFQGTEYMQRIREVSDLYPEVRSVNIVYADLDQFDADLAAYLLEHPDLALLAGKQAMKNLMHAEMRKAEINLRPVELPRDSKVDIRELRAKHVGKMVCVEGLVRKATEVRPKITDGLFQCLRCGHVIKEAQEGLFFKEPMECYKEQDGCGRSAGSTKFKLLTEESRFVDTQKVEVQESPEGLRGGAQPERLTGYLEDDAAGKVSPGDRVILNGILRSVQKGQPAKSTLFDINLDIVSAESQRHEYEEIQITEEDESQIRDIAKSPEVFRKIVASISPTIYGYDTEKEALALQLFGGVAKELDDGTRIRGDIHILLIGDPGVAKCVTGDADVTMADGSVRKIKDIVEDGLKNGTPEEIDDGFTAPIDLQVLTFSLRGRMEAGKAIRVWKRTAPKKMVRVTTAKGRTLVCTPTHPLFIHGGRWIRPLEVSYIKEGALIAISTGLAGAPTNKEGEDFVFNLGFDMDEVVKKEEIKPPEEWVYDIEVDVSHNYVANGIVSHNSQMLRYMSRLAPRGIYASGKSSSAAGLTAAAVKDDFGEGRWTLEAGALVLADRGLAAVDELDKMTEQDRSSMHEAMEQQQISVAKAGITATLQCRCSLLGAANPKYGRFQDAQYIADQINMPPALLSRFDLIFAMTDKTSSDRDASITQHILKAHRRGQVRIQADPSNIEGGLDGEKILKDTTAMTPVLDRDFLRKYVAYSKKMSPILTDEAMRIISEFYLKIRKQGEGEGQSVPITARQLEAFVRLSEASARARLSPVVTAEDAQRAVRIVDYYLRRIAGEGDKLDFDIIATGTSHSQREQIGIIKKLIGQLSKDADPKKGVSTEEINKACLAEGITEDRAKMLLKRLAQNGEIYSPSTGHYKLASEG